MGRAPSRVVIACAAAALGAACGLGLVGTEDPTGAGDGGTLATPGAEAGGPDGLPPPANDASAIDDASTPRDASADADADAGVPPPPPLWECNGVLVSDCSLCATRPLRCVMCASDGGPNLWRTCVPPNTTCFGSYKPAGYDWCRCGNDPSRCKLPEQGCNPYDNGVCVTCGEQLTNGDPCKSGGSCNQSQSKCQ